MGAYVFLPPSRLSRDVKRMQKGRSSWVWGLRSRIRGISRVSSSGSCVGRRQAWTSCLIPLWPCCLHPEVKLCAGNPKVSVQPCLVWGGFLQESGKAWVGHPGCLSYCHFMYGFGSLESRDRNYDLWLVYLPLNWWRIGAGGEGGPQGRLGDPKRVKLWRLLKKKKKV